MCTHEISRCCAVLVAVPCDRRVGRGRGGACAASAQARHRYVLGRRGRGSVPLPRGHQGPRRRSSGCRRRPTRPRRSWPSCPGAIRCWRASRRSSNGASGLVDQVQRSASGRWFFLKRDPGENQFRLVWRERVDGPDRLLVRSRGARARRPASRTRCSISRPRPTARKIAYAMQAGGGEIGTLHVVDVATGKELIAADRPHPLRRRRLARRRQRRSSTRGCAKATRSCRRRSGSATAPCISTRSIAPAPTARCSAHRATRSSACPPTPPVTSRKSRAPRRRCCVVYLGVDRNVLAYVARSRGGEGRHGASGDRSSRPTTSVHAVGAAHGFDLREECARRAALQGAAHAARRARHRARPRS